MLAAIVAWLSQGSVAIVDGGGRIALLPYNASALTLAAVAAAATVGARSPSAHVHAALPARDSILPWLPVGTPALLMWSGPLALVPWCRLVPRPVRLQFDSRAMAGRPVVAARAVRRRYRRAIYAIAAWQVAPSRPGGDEPHYLVITQSLLLDQRPQD